MSSSRSWESVATFPEDELRQIIPAGIITEWENIGATQSVSWVWVMLCELSLVSFLTPNARFFPLASFAVYSVNWMFFLHPGSCHTSNLLRLYHNVLQGLEQKANAHRAARRAHLKAAALPNATLVAKAELKRQLCALNDISLRFGTGSLEGIGLRMSETPALSAASGFLPEGSQFLGWLMGEATVNKAIATQLWERMAWQRDTVNKLRSFELSYPFLGVMGALHVEDVWPIFAQHDPLGMRSRLCMVYTRPIMKRARDIEIANNALGNAKGSDGLEKRLVDRFFRVYQAHAAEHIGEASTVWGNHHRICLGFHFAHQATRSFVG